MFLDIFLEMKILTTKAKPTEGQQGIIVGKMSNSRLFDDKKKSNLLEIKPAATI